MFSAAVGTMSTGMALSNTLFARSQCLNNIFSCIRTGAPVDVAGLVGNGAKFEMLKVFYEKRQ